MASHTCLQFAWTLSIMLHCSHEGHFAVQYVAPGRSLHMPLVILHIYTGTNTVRMNITYTLPKRAQSPCLGPCSPVTQGELQLTLASTIEQSVSTLSPVPWCRHTYMVLHMCISSLNLQHICLLADPQGVLSVHTNVLQSPWDNSYKLINGIPNPSLVLSSHVKNI